VANTNIESEEFFSKIIETIIPEDEKRHPSDHYAAFKQWKQKHVKEFLFCLDEEIKSFVFSALKEEVVYTQSITSRRMNGFETLIDVAQRRHLGEVQRYFLNVV
jgi:hypothetical protein